MSIEELMNYKNTKGRARGRARHEPGKMNKLEAQYAAEKLGGVFYRFESVKFRLADKTYYTPDFWVMRENGQIEAHEVKGFWEDDARVKIKVFAEMYPEIVVRSAQLVKKVWVIETFTSGVE